MGRIVRGWGGLWSVSVLLSCAYSIAASRPAWAADEIAAATPFRVRVHNEVGQAVKRALAGADQRLAEPGCAEVLTDFRDASGRPLTEVLEVNGVSARGYLRWIVFADGRGLKRCGGKGTLAITEPGSRVVFICPTAFFESSPADEEAALIHEMLHTLGLGENPPRSRDITARVQSRCGSSPRPRAR